MGEPVSDILERFGETVNRLSKWAEKGLAVLFRALLRRLGRLARWLSSRYIAVVQNLTVLIDRLISIFWDLFKLAGLYIVPSLLFSFLARRGSNLWHIATIGWWAILTAAFFVGRTVGDQARKGSLTRDPHYRKLRRAAIQFVLHMITVSLLIVLIIWALHRTWPEAKVLTHVIPQPGGDSNEEVRARTADLRNTRVKVWYSIDRVRDAGALGKHLEGMGVSVTYSLAPASGEQETRSGIYSPSSHSEIARAIQTAAAANVPLPLFQDDRKETVVLYLD